CPIVLIHESWPYAREAAFLASVYPHVYMDLSFQIPHVDQREMLGFTRAALGVAPASKLMVATDSWGLPEHYYLGARRARAVLGLALAELTADHVLTAAQAEQVAEWVTHRTALRLYGLG